MNDLSLESLKYISGFVVNLVCTGFVPVLYWFTGDIEPVYLSLNRLYWKLDPGLVPS